MQLDTLQIFGENYFHMHMEFETLSDNGVGQDCGWRGYANFACGIMTPASVVLLGISGTMVWSNLKD